MQIGTYHDLEVAKEVDFGVYLNSPIGELLLPTKYVPEGLKVGEVIHVFIYKDSEDRPIATTLEPYAQLDEFASLEVKDSNAHGAFLDWGLEKDLFVPKKEQHEPFQLGKRYIVRVCMDHKTERLIGTSKLKPFLKEADEHLQEGQSVELLIYRKTDKGYMAVIDQTYAGLIYENEIFEPIAVGDVKTGFIKKIREDDKIDLSLNKTGRVAVDDNREVVIELLKKNDGFMPYHDKSDAEDIAQVFNMSKKGFKKAIGGLYKDKLIKIESNGIRLL